MSGHDMQSGLNPIRQGSRAIATAIRLQSLLHSQHDDARCRTGASDSESSDIEKASALSGPQRQGDGSQRLRSSSACRRLCCTVSGKTGARLRSLARRRRPGPSHALALDTDIGPQLQVHKASDRPVNFARARGFDRPLSAAELEMMNLSWRWQRLRYRRPYRWRCVNRCRRRTSFQRAGYERNPVAICHNTVAKL